MTGGGGSGVLCTGGSSYGAGFGGGITVATAIGAGAGAGVGGFGLGFGEGDGFSTCAGSAYTGGGEAISGGGWYCAGGGVTARTTAGAGAGRRNGDGRRRRGKRGRLGHPDRHAARKGRTDREKSGVQEFHPSALIPYISTLNWNCEFPPPF